MATTANTMKRPVIFIKNLSQEDIADLCRYSENFKSWYEDDYHNSAQIYIYKSGRLGVANSISVYETVEVICTTYQEFITKWEQYRLWVMLQTE